MPLVKVNSAGTENVAGVSNLIINGAMAINQRGATSGVTSGYFVDRFTLSGCSASAVITSNTPTEFPKAITVSATSGNPIVTQKIESTLTQHLSGKVVTASFFAKNVSNATTLYASLQYAGSADNWSSSTTISEQNLGTLTSDWVRYTASWTVPSGGLNGLQLNILCAGTSTFTMGVTGVQLQEGSLASDFQHRLFGEELQLCKRYTHVAVADQAYAHFGGGFATSATLAYADVIMPVEMRTNPAVTPNGSFRNYADDGGRPITSGPTLLNGGNKTRISFQSTSGTGMTAGDFIFLGANNDVDAFMLFDAEL